MTKVGRAVALATAFVACGIGPVESEVVDRTTPAQVTYSGYSGLLGLTLYLVVDSSASEVRVHCSTARVRGQDGDCRTVVERSLSLSRPQLRSLFSATSAGGFLRSRSIYDTSPAAYDGPEYEVTITRNGMTRTIKWSRATDLDEPVREFVGTVLTTAGFPAP